MRRSFLQLSPYLLLTALLAFVLIATGNAVMGQQLQFKRVGVAPAQPTPEEGKTALTDEEALKKAGLSPDEGPKLLEYLRNRTVMNRDEGKINEIIARFGADDFDERVKAAEEVERFGTAAIGPLKKAASDRDPEIAYRAKLALSHVEKVPQALVAAAAVRAIAKLKTDGAAAVLVGYLPIADNNAVANDIREALVALAVANGKAEPALIAALTSDAPVCRTAAYVALIEGGPTSERIHIKDAYPKVKEAVLKDLDVEAKFAGLWSLALVTREKEFIPELISMIPKLPRGRLWQVEELLLQFAGTHPKDGRFLKSAEVLEKARDAWLTWWKEKGTSIDLVKFAYKPRTLGITDVIEMDNTGLHGGGRIVSLGPDLKERWRIGNATGANDMRVAPNGNIWIVEMNNNLISERTTTGTVITTRRSVVQPMNIDLLPDGGMLVVSRNQVAELDKDGTAKWTYTRPNNTYDIMGGRRLPNGETLFVTNTNTAPNMPGQNVFRLDKKGEEVKQEKPLAFGRIQQMQTMDVIGADKVLVCEINMVAEYDLKTGKQTWFYNCPPNSAPRSCQRLPNGNTLITFANQNKVVEVDPSSEIVWEYQAKDGMTVSRAFRR